MKVLINDSSVLLNLLAANCLEAVAEAFDWQFAICVAVQNEAKKLRDPVTGEMVPVDIAPMVDSGSLQILDITGADEQVLYIEQASYVDDGEAMSIAIAANRGLELAIDDKQASNHVRRSFSGLKLWTTPELLKHWAEHAKVSQARLKDAIQLIEARARYFPGKSHVLFEWWVAARRGVE